jgi:hypothetical protein
MKIMLSLCCVTLAMLFHPALLKNENQSAFRVLDVPQGDIGLTYFGSMAITTSEDLNAFLAEIAQQQMWGNRQAFVDALVNAKIDFDREALVLLRYDKSGGGRFPFETPVLKDKALLVEVHIEQLFGPALGIISSYCYTLAVSKSLIDTVEYRVTGPPTALRDPPILLFPTKYRRGLNLVWRDPPPKPLNCPKLALKCPTELVEKGTISKLVVEGLSSKDDVAYAWSLVGGEIVEGQGTASLKVRINEANRFVTATVDIGGGIDPNCEHTFACTFGTLK